MSKGKRIRDERAKERTMAEEDDKLFDRIEAWANDPDSMPEITYYRCSMDAKHAEHCVVGPTLTNPDTGEQFPGERTFGEEGSLGQCEELSKMDVLVHHEQFKWHKLELDTNNVNSNTFMMGCRIEAILEVLINELGIDEATLNRYYMPALLQNMRNVREAITQSVVEARRQALTARSMPGTGIIGPNGRPL